LEAKVKEYQQSNAPRRGHTGKRTVATPCLATVVALGVQSPPHAQCARFKALPVIIDVSEVLLSMRDDKKRACMRQTRRTSRSAVSHALLNQVLVDEEDTYRGRDEEANQSRPSAGRSRRPYDVGGRQTTQCPVSLWRSLTAPPTCICISHARLRGLRQRKMG
jgi:hypothetical protein